MSKKNNNTEEKMDTVDYMEKFSDWVEKNSKIFVVTFSIFVLCVGSYWAYSLYENNLMTTVAEESGMLTRQVELLERAIKEAKNPESDEFKSNLEKEIKTLKKLSLDISSRYPSQSSTDLALIKVSGFLDAQGETKMALGILDSSKVSSKRILSGVLLLLKSKLQNKLGQDEDALKNYDKILKEEGWKAFHAEALIQKALLNKVAGDFESAKNALEKAKTLNKSGAFFEDAEKYLKLIQYEKSKSKADNG